MKKNNNIRNNFSSSSLLKGDYSGFWVSAFTLIEVLVSITIFSVMMISIMSIYIISTDITVKSDINRMMQVNLKNVTSTIAEDIRKDWIIWVSSETIDQCNSFDENENYKYGSKLCTKSWNEYYLAKNVTWIYTRVDSSECSSLIDHCVIYNLNKWPLTNSFVSIKDLDFYFSKEAISKVTMVVSLHPAVKKWVKSNLIEESKMIFQTTISERPF